MLSLLIACVGVVLCCVVLVVVMTCRPALRIYLPLECQLICSTVSYILYIYIHFIH